MHEIDAKLGGTTPLDIILDAPASFFIKPQPVVESSDTAPTGKEEYKDDFEDDFDDFGDDLESSSGSNLAFSSYWYNQAGLQKLREIQDSLEALPATGKVLSLASSMSVFDNLKDAEPMDNIDLGFMYNVLSQENKNTLFVPYLSADANQAHINIRVFESHKGLDRNQLIKDIRHLLVEQHGLEDEQVNISGMVVLYNNMLNSLFSSQIMTLGTVFAVILLMFIVLFRNFKLALITLVPNIFSAGVVLGLMGLFSIPLDLMTITIAAISVGIAVDNSIHFVARFIDEFKLTNKYGQSIDAATHNVGQAMFYTTIVITAGFLIMVFSNFVPTMYFGILTSIAMVTALIANLVMLPMLLKKFKPI
jgi:predicted RND superfamily exporter protein